MLTEHDDAGHSFQFTKMDKKKDNSGYEQRSTRITATELSQIAEAAVQISERIVQLIEGLESIRVLKNGK